MGDVVQMRRPRKDEESIDGRLNNTVESLKITIGRMECDEARVEFMFRLIKQLVCWVCLTKNGSAAVLVEWVKKSVFDIRKEL